MLHTRSTGRKLIWNSSMSATMLAELRHGEQQLAELERAGSLAQSDPAAAMAILDRLDKERRPSLWAARRTHWLTWVVAAIAALYLILQIAWLVSS